MDVRFLFTVFVLVVRCMTLWKCVALSPKRCMQTHKHMHQLLFRVTQQSSVPTTFMLSKHLAINVYIGVLYADFRCTPGHIANARTSYANAETMRSNGLTNTGSIALDRNRVGFHHFGRIVWWHVKFAENWKFITRQNTIHLRRRSVIIALCGCSRMK